MKRKIALILCLVLSILMIFMLSSCDKGEDTLIHTKTAPAFAV